MLYYRYHTKKTGKPLMKNEVTAAMTANVIMGPWYQHWVKVQGVMNEIKETDEERYEMILELSRITPHSVETYLKFNNEQLEGLLKVYRK